MVYYTTACPKCTNAYILCQHCETYLRARELGERIEKQERDKRIRDIACCNAIFAVPFNRWGTGYAHFEQLDNALGPPEAVAVDGR